MIFLEEADCRKCDRQGECGCFLEFERVRYNRGESLWHGGESLESGV
jgi:hypothetical protein